jgi:hypothetical protein
VTSELRLDLARRDVPYTDDLVLGTCSKILGIRTEAHTAYVEVSFLAWAWILQNRDDLARLDIVDLSGTIAPSGYKAAVVTETNAAHDTAMQEVVNELNIQNSGHVWIVHGIPVWPLALEMLRQLLRVKLS